MALEVAERAVIADHLEPVRGPFEGTTGPVTAVGPFTDVGREERPTLLGTETSHSTCDFFLRAAEKRRTDRGQDLLFPSGSKSTKVTEGRPDGPLGGRSGKAIRSGKSSPTTRAVSAPVRSR